MPLLIERQVMSVVINPGAGIPGAEATEQRLRCLHTRVVGREARTLRAAHLHTPDILARCA
jgi:hypothetical protein